MSAVIRHIYLTQILDDKLSGWMRMTSISDDFSVYIYIYMVVSSFFCMSKESERCVVLEWLPLCFIY